MKALGNLYHRRRPADFLRHGIRQRAHLVAWKDCRWLPKPSGSLPDHERGTLASRSPQRGNWIPEEDREVSRNSVPLGPLGQEPRGP